MRPIEVVTYTLAAVGAVGYIVVKGQVEGLSARLIGRAFLGALCLGFVVLAVYVNFVEAVLD